MTRLTIAQAEEADFDLNQIKKLTPYLNDIKYKKAFSGKTKETLLSARQRAFAWYYTYNGNIKADAYRRAFYSRKNEKSGLLEYDKSYEKKYKGKTPFQQRLTVEAGGLFSKPYIAEAISRIRTELMRNIKTDVPQTMIEQLFIQATYDPSVFVNHDGSPAFKDWKDIPEKYRCVVKGIEKKYYGKDADTSSIVLKLADREEARKHLLKIVPDLLLPDKHVLIHKTIDGDGKEIGIDTSKMTDEALRETFKNLGE
jgi:hypothetical protein